MQRQKFIAALVCLLSALAFGWCLSISRDSRYHRDSEMSRVTQGLQQVSKKLEAGSPDQKLIEQSAKNLTELSEGSVLIEERALHIAALLALFTLGFACLNLLSRPSKEEDGKEQKQKNKIDSNKATMESFQDTLQQTIEELGAIKAQLKVTGSESNLQESPVRGMLEAQSSDIVTLESQLIFIKNQAEQLSSQNSKSMENLQRLSGQADDASAVSTAARLEWNALTVKLSQFREAQDKIRIKVEMLDKLQKSSQEMLKKSLEFSTVHSHHSELGKVNANRMYEESKGITEIFSKLIHAMSESNGDVDLANKLVKGLSERAEEIVNIIDVIDDIAEQTNQLALNASIEAARAGEQGKGFAVVAAEVRHLAARSSTATRSITELLETIQAEASRASSCLEKTHLSVGGAHARIVDVDHRCRETMNLSRHVASELGDMIRITTEHSQDIQAIEKQSLEVSRMTEKLVRQLDDVDAIAQTVHRESNHLAVGTDRLSRLLSRQYFAIQYSERLTAGQSEGFSALMKQGSELLGRTQSMRTTWDEQFRSLLAAPLLMKSGKDSNRSLSQRIDYCQSNLDIIRGRSPTLGMTKANDDKFPEDPAGEDDDIDLKVSIQGPDDDELSIATKIGKAS
jgi:methyl-accepting chemotaxis protein